MPLTASSNPYVLKVGETVPPLKVRWDEDYEVKIWERKIRPGSAPTLFVLRNLTNSERAAKEIVVPILAGQIYTVALVHEDSTFNPNATGLEDPPPDSLLTVPAILNRHAPMIRMFDPFGRGGTFIEGFINTFVDPAATPRVPKKTWVTMQVGKTGPVEVVGSGPVGDRLKKIDNPVVEKQSFNTSTHGMECAPLVPGQLYSVIVTAVDDQGNWDFVEGSVDTKKRFVEINIKKIVVVNDGDTNTDGEAEFRASIQESGAAVPGSVVKAFSLGNDEYRVRTGQEINISWKHQIGPKAINESVDSIVSIHTIGFEYDGIKGTDKAGSSFNPAILNFLSGRLDEEEENEDVVLKAKPLNDDEFEYKLIYDWKVSYR